MKVAIPLFGTRVSPRFDCGPVLLVAELADGAVASSQAVADAASNGLQRIALLRELGVDTVVCGAITGFLHRHLVGNRIRVFPWVSGEASEVLGNLTRGKPPLAAPSSERRGRGCRARGCGRGGPRWSRGLREQGNSK